MIQIRRYGEAVEAYKQAIRIYPGKPLFRQIRTKKFVVQLNSEKIIRRLGKLGNILGLTPAAATPLLGIVNVRQHDSGAVRTQGQIPDRELSWSSRCRSASACARRARGFPLLVGPQAPGKFPRPDEPVLGLAGHALPDVLPEHRLRESGLDQASQILR